MIVSASYRTDIPAFYAAWFARALQRGAVEVPNPYGGRPYTVDLTQGAVDGFVFWTRNVEPFVPVLKSLFEKQSPFAVQYTVIGYPRVLDRSVPEPDRAVASIREISGLFGPRCVVWRYDPIVLTSLTPPEWHERRFSMLARAMAGTTDEVVVSFMSPYAKTRRNLGRAAREAGFTWWTGDRDERQSLTRRLASIARSQAMRLTVCADPDLAQDTGVQSAACIDGERMSALAGRPITARRKSYRAGCRCVESRDIGRYDSCPHGCVYCYAVRNPESVRKSFDAGAAWDGGGIADPQTPGP